MSKFKKIFLTLLIITNVNAFDEFLISDIRIIGLQRVSTGSIFNVIPISVGDKIDNRKSRDIVKSFRVHNYPEGHMLAHSLSQ